MFDPAGLGDAELIDALRATTRAEAVATITWRTRLVTDEDALALVDAALAGIAPTRATCRHYAALTTC